MTKPRRAMGRFARWHIWLGWLAGVPLLMWTLSGLLMVSRPIEVVRGEHLRRDLPETTLPRDLELTPLPAGTQRYTLEMRGDLAVAQIDYADGRQELRNARTGRAISPIDEAAARRIVEEEIVTATAPGTVPPRSRILSATLYAADEVPIDFRRPIAVWRMVLEDGTYVYVGRDSARIEAVRTRWWRIFDVMWGLHIMDLEAREDTSHPILILFAALAALSTLFGCILLFRRRRARQTAGA